MHKNVYRLHHLLKSCSTLISNARARGDVTPHSMENVDAFAYSSVLLLLLLLTFWDVPKVLREYKFKGAVFSAASLLLGVSQSCTYCSAVQCSV